MDAALPIIGLILLILLGGSMLAAYNYFILYLIKAANLTKLVDSKISVVILFIFAVLILSLKASSIAEAFGAMISVIILIYLFTSGLFRQRGTYKDLSINIRISSTIFSSSSYLMIFSSINGGF